MRDKMITLGGIICLGLFIVAGTLMTMMARNLTWTKETGGSFVIAVFTATVIFAILRMYKLLNKKIEPLF